MKSQLNDIVIAKMTLKKVMHQIDHIETLLAYGEGVGMKMTIADWLTEMRVHLRRLEVMAEQSAS